MTLIDITENEAGICVLAISKLDVLWPWMMGKSPWVDATDEEKLALMKKLDEAFPEG